jgi:hypothetical protein
MKSNTAIGNRPPIFAKQAEKEIGKIERKLIAAIYHWVSHSPEQSIMITPDLGVFITSPHGTGKNVEIEQVRINEYNKIVVITEDDSDPVLIDQGDFSTDSIMYILKAIEQTLIVK